MIKFFLTFLVVSIVYIFLGGYNIVIFPVVFLLFFIVFCLLYFLEKTLFKKWNWAKWIKWSIFALWLGIVLVDMSRYAFFSHLCSTQTKVEIYNKEKYDLFRRVSKYRNVNCYYSQRNDICRYKIVGKCSDNEELFKISNLFDLIGEDDDMESVFFLYKDDKPIMMFYNNDAGHFTKKKANRYHEVLVDVETAEVIYKVDDIVSKRGLISFIANPYQQHYSCIGARKGAFSRDDYLKINSYCGSHGIRGLLKNHCKYEDSTKPLCAKVSAEE